MEAKRHRRMGAQAACGSMPNFVIQCQLILTFVEEIDLSSCLNRSLFDKIPRLLFLLCGHRHGRMVFGAVTVGDV